MRWMFFLGFILAYTSACPPKDLALDCFYKKADLNHDNRISRIELRKTIDNYLPWFKRWPFKVFGGISRIMRDCDANHDGYLTKAEAYSLDKTCLETCYKRSNTVSVFKC